jgi:death-on-curing protein
MLPAFLNTDDIITINKKVVIKYGGFCGLRGRSLVEICVDSVINNYYYKKPDLIELAVIYVFSIAQNHPFLDGNKRTALMSMLIFLDLNDVETDFLAKELEDNVVKIVTKEIKEDEFLRWIKKFIRL